MLTRSIKTTLSVFFAAVIFVCVYPSSNVLGQTDTPSGLSNPSPLAIISESHRDLSIAGYSGGARMTGKDEDFHVENPLSLDYGRILLKDIRHVLSAPWRWTYRDWSAFSLQIMMVRSVGTCFDEYARKMSWYNRGDFTNTLSNTFNHFGGYYADYVIGGFYLSGLLFKNKTAEMVALDCFAATFITSEIVTPGLKSAFGRQRPYRNSGPSAFSPFSGHDSFPSGHTVRAFVTASVVSAHYRQRWVKILAYGIASFVAFARVNYDVHFLSDVTAGALVGIAIGRGIVRFNKKLRGAPH